MLDWERWTMQNEMTTQSDANCEEDKIGMESKAKPHSAHLLSQIIRLSFTYRYIQLYCFI